MHMLHSPPNSFLCAFCGQGNYARMLDQKNLAMDKMADKVDPTPKFSAQFLSKVTCRHFSFVDL